jgi:hypothetical protein
MVGFPVDVRNNSSSIRVDASAAQSELTCHGEEAVPG